MIITFELELSSIPDMISVVLILLLSFLVLMHVLILIKVIPYNMLWGSLLKSDQDMVRFESVSLVVSIVFLWLAIEATGYIEGIVPSSWSGWILWVLGGFFALNTIGNLTSKNKVERYVFAVKTLALTSCCFYLAMQF